MSNWRSNDIKRRAEWLASQSFVILAIQVPKKNEKTALSAEQFFASLHGIFKSDPPVQEHLSFEIIAKEDSVAFYVFVPLHLRDFVEGQLYAQYPDLEISQVPDYTNETKLEGLHVATTHIQLTKDDVYPIKTYSDLEIDPLAGLTAVMGNLAGEEQIWFQMVVRPVGDDWQNKGVSHVQAIRAGKKPGAKGAGFLGRAANLSVRLVREVVSPGTGFEEAKSAEAPKLSAPEEAALKGVESKITKLGFEALLRLVVIAPTEVDARARSQGILAAFKQYNTTNLNGFKAGETKIDNYQSWLEYINREFEKKGSVLNIEELASIYHFPTASVESNAISWAGSKKAEAPLNIPLRDESDPATFTLLGKTDFRNHVEEFGIKTTDRMRHIYIIGKSGTGKSTLLENMIIDDMASGRGVIVVDPHGELADKIIQSVPEHRIDDVVILDPSDRNYPPAFNLLEQVDEDFKPVVASGFVGIFKKIFGNSWGPRLEHFLRNTVLALLDHPDSTMLGIPRMLTEPMYREEVIQSIKDTVVKDFWINEFGRLDEKQRTEAIGPILNKVGQFLSTSTIRNIVGQPKSTIDVRKIMDEKKILVVNLSKGKIGEDNMALLGAMIVTKVQLAAMSRADVAFSDRPECFLYVDEFQNFATESFASILSEARKYNLGLTIAHQYMAQLTDEVRNAVIGNVGTIISFRVGTPDAEALGKEFAPIFEPHDMVNLQMARVYIKLLVDGVASQAFSAQTLAPKTIDTDFGAQVIAHSRMLYTKSRPEAEEIIDEAAGYRKRREMEDAKKRASDILAYPSPMNEQRPNVVERPRPVVPDTAFVPPTQELQPVQQVEAPKEVGHIMEEELPTEAPIEEGKERKPVKEKPLKVMDGWVYKEVSQRGGMKWYIGEKESEVLERRAAKAQAQAERSQEIADSPVPPTLTEQSSNILPMVQDESFALPVVVGEQEKDVQTTTSLQEGQRIDF